MVSHMCVWPHLQPLVTPHDPWEKVPFTDPSSSTVLSLPPKEAMSCSLSLDPGLIGRQTLVYEARPPGFKAPLCSPLDVGPRASDFPSLDHFVTCEPGAPASQWGKAGKPESSFWHRVGLECYFRWAPPRKPSLVTPTHPTPGFTGPILLCP